MRHLLKLLSAFVRLPLVALPSPDSPADEADTQTQKEKGVVYFMAFQVPGPPKAALTEWFTAQGYPPEKALTGGGGGGGYTTGKMCYEGHGQGLSSKTADGIDVGMGNGGGSVGIAVFKNDRLRIYPMIGIGGGGISVGKPFASDNVPPPADAPEHEKRPGVALIIVEAGLGVDITIPVPMRDGKTLIALRFGYRFVKGRHPEAPDLSGPFLRVMTGMKF